MPRNKIVGKNTKPNSNKATGRNYDYDKKYQATDKMKKYRAELNKVNRKLQEEGKAKVGDNKDVAHKKDRKNGGTLKKNGYTLQSQSKNRAKK